MISGEDSALVSSHKSHLRAVSHVACEVTYMSAVQCLRRSLSMSGSLIARSQRHLLALRHSLEAGSVVGRFRLRGPRLGTRATPAEPPANRACVIEFERHRTSR